MKKNNFLQKVNKNFTEDVIFTIREDERNQIIKNYKHN